jgi:phosphate uptake regulator
MKRKIIQIADSTQLVSLPRKWSKKYNLTKGEELEIEEKGNSLLVKTEKGDKVCSAEIDVSNLDRTSILYYMEILYRMGYDEIHMKFSNQETEHYRLGKKVSVISVIHYVSSRLIGMEIIQQKQNSVQLKSLQITSNKEFDTVVKRTFILLKDTSKDFIKGAENADDVLLQTIEEKHDSIARFISYGLRILNKHGPTENQNPFILYHTLNQLDKLTDIIKYSARELIEHKK